jgi:histone-lysine N-methyltransferase SETD7
VCGRAARLADLSEEQGVLVPRFVVTGTDEFRRWIASDTRLLGPPHLPDPYERLVGRVAQSVVEGAGEGLYARRHIPAGTLVAYYNGIRMTKEQHSPYPETGYSIFLEWKERGSKSGDHMDLPPEVRVPLPPLHSQLHSSDHYTATLAHKLNHSFISNCEWSNAEHPCYGFVPSVTTFQPVAEGEELTVNYGLDMEVGGGDPGGQQELIVFPARATMVPGLLGGAQLYPALTPCVLSSTLNIYAALIRKVCYFISLSVIIVTVAHYVWIR